MSRMFSGRGLLVAAVALATITAAEPASSQAPAGNTVQDLMKPPERPRTVAGPEDALPAPLSDAGLANLIALARLYGAVRFFHPTDAAINTDWDAWLIGAVVAAEQSDGGQGLRDALARSIGGVAPTVTIVPSAAAAAVPPPPRPANVKEAFRWRYRAYSDASESGQSRARTIQPGIGPSDLARIDLGNGLTAVVPLAAWRRGPVIPDFSAMSSYLKSPEFVSSGMDRSTRLAAVIKAWSTLRNFYPYFDVAAGDWDAQLAPALHSAATDRDDLIFADTIRRLVGRLGDGHGRIVYAPAFDGSLPLQWDSIEGRLVVTHVGPPATAAGIKPGDIVEAVNGVGASAALHRQSLLASGSPQAIGFVARRNLRAGRAGDRAQLRVSGPSGQRTVELTYGEDRVPGYDSPSRPARLSEIEPGIQYLDLTRVTDEEIAAAHPVLAKAKGVVLDLRGYPRPGIDFLSHMVDQPVRGAQFDWPIFTRPGGMAETHEGGAWTIIPAAPRWSSNIVILIDIPAGSYAESLLALIQGNRLATLVGEPTSGANGNIGIIRLPGDYRAVFTSMRVRNLDGSQHHLLGIRPDVTVSHTVAAVRSGRDLMLEKGLEIVRSRAK